MESNYAIVLDYLKDGYADAFMSFKKSKPVIQLVNTHDFSLIEATLREPVSLKIQGKFDVNYKSNPVVERIRRLRYDKLTTTAKSELEFAVESLIKQNEEKYVKFYNAAQPISTRMHVFELLSGIGKKHMWAIIEERKNKPFESFEDFKERMKLDPLAPLVKKVLEEIEGKAKHYIFVPQKPPSSDRQKKFQNRSRRRF